MGLGMDTDWGGSWVREQMGWIRDMGWGRRVGGVWVMVLRRDKGLGWIWVAGGSGFGSEMDWKREMVRGWDTFGMGDGFGDGD